MLACSPSEQNSDSVCPFLPGGVPPVLGEREHTEGAQTLPEQADEVERRLGLALKGYRERAEDILDQHFNAMGKVQLAHDHEVSMLKAENAKLREMIGKADDPSFLPAVLFQTMTHGDESNAKKKDTKNRMKKGAEDDDDGKSVSARKARKKDAGSDQPGGSWQQFVAWVPNAAALLNPEPWKPLPNQGFSAPPSSGSIVEKSLRSQKSSQHVEQGERFWGCMPSMTKDAKDKKKEDSDSDNSNDSDLHRNRGKLELIPVWKPTLKERQSWQVGSKVSEVASLQSDDFQVAMTRRSSAESEHDDYLQAARTRFIINPDAGIRIVWDLSSLFMVVYDMIMVPMAVFAMPDDLFWLIMDWITRMFWTVDMGWSCCTGVVLEDGRVEYNLRQILKRYFKTWLALDIFIVGSDWAGVILSSGGMGLTRLARVSRIARIVRLLRLVRMQEVIANITERIQSDKMILCLQIVKVLVFLFACCHITACGWWGIGNSTSGTSWITVNGYSNQIVGKQYLVCLHWSLSMFSGGMEELLPTTSVERCYVVLIWVLSFISGLVMLSFLTSSLTQQYIIGGSGARQMATLRKYLNQNKVPKNLIKRLCRSAKHAISGDLQPDSVDLLHVVSEPLRIEMHYEMFSRVLSCHPFFVDLLRESNQVVRRVCHSCMSMLLLDSGDVLFRRGDEPADGKMYFVFSGVLEYVDKNKIPHHVVEKQWVSEPALWTTWKHQGTLTAVTDAKMAIIEADSFQDICGQYMKKMKGKGFNPKIYAAAYIDELNLVTSEWSDLPEPSSLH